MWTMLGTVLLGVMKWIAEKIVKKKLNDRQFVEFIKAHQQRRMGAGKTAVDFEDALRETLDQLEKEENVPTKDTPTQS